VFVILASHARSRVRSTTSAVEKYLVPFGGGCPSGRRSLTKTSQLADLGRQEQARFVAFDAFDWLSGKWKFDEEWIQEIGTKPAEGYIQLQPLIGELEADLVIRALEKVVRDFAGLALRGKGRSYLGRYFLRANLTAPMVRKLADDFTSIQSIHPPIRAFAASLPPEIRSFASSAPTIPSASLRTMPCVGVVDTAVPPEHVILAPYRRGAVTGLNCSNTENDHHGSMVASRVVFGDIDLSDPAAVPVPSCRFFEVRVGTGESRTIRAESVSGALATAIGAAPDVRVFNLSFDSARALDDLPQKQRAETLKQIEELDNFAFDQDVLIVVAAGNVPAGIVPNQPYPLHYDDPVWQLRSFPRAFNALTCGGIVSRLSAGGLAGEINAPSPFTRVGPGFADSPKPDFCAPAGNIAADYRRLDGAGIWGYSTVGDPKEDVGTSFAAPLLAREAAFVFEELSRRCPGDSRPFSCMVKAVLALTADDVTLRLSEGLQPLAKRTLGFGAASVERFRQPSAQRARFFWQGVIAHEDDVAKVQLPIPSAWVKHAAMPQLSLCVAWDTPVSSAAEKQWSCRDVEIHVRPGPDSRAVNGSRRRVHGYPLFKKHWNLKRARDKDLVEGDFWVLEFLYSQVAAYAAGHAVPTSQRIALAAEIWDEAENPVEPHQFVQALPIASTLVQLSNTAAWLPQRVAITSDV